MIQTVVVSGRPVAAVEQAQSNARDGDITQVIGFKRELDLVKWLANDAQLKTEPISRNGLLLWQENE